MLSVLSGKKAVLAAAAGLAALAAGAAFARRGGAGLDGGPEEEGVISSEDVESIREWATPQNILAAMVRDGVITREQAAAVTRWRTHLQSGRAGPCAFRPAEAA